MNIQINKKIILPIIIAIYCLTLLIVHFTIGLHLSDIIFLLLFYCIGGLTVFTSLLYGLIGAFVVTLIYGLAVIFSANIGVIDPIRVNYIFLFLPAIICLIASRLTFDHGVEEEIQKHLSLLERIDDLSFRSHQDYFDNLAEEIEKSKENDNHISLMFISIQPFDEFADLYEVEYGKPLIGYLSDQIIDVTHTIDRHYQLETGLFFIILTQTSDDEAIRIEEHLISKLERISLSSDHAISVDMNIAYRTNKEYLSAEDFHNSLYSLIKDGDQDA